MSHFEYKVGRELLGDTRKIWIAHASEWLRFFQAFTGKWVVNNEYANFQIVTYEEILIDGEPHYRKFKDPSQIGIIVAGGTAGKFSAVMGGWLTGTKGSQIVTYAVKWEVSETRRKEIRCLRW